MGTIQAAVWDLTSNTLPPYVEPGSVDVILLIFVLSALHPSEWANAVSNVHKVGRLSHFIHAEGAADDPITAVETGREGPNPRLRPIRPHTTAIQGWTPSG